MECEMKLKQLLLIAALVMPFSVGAATFDVTGDFSGSDFSFGPSDVELSGDWSFTFDDTASLTGISLSTLSVTPTGDVNLTGTTFDTSNVFAEVSLNSLSGNISNITIYGQNAGTGQSGGIDDLYVVYMFNGSLHQVGYTDSDTNFALSAVDSGSFVATEVSAVPLPAALWLFGPALLGFMGFRRKAVNTVNVVAA